ncbi:hypothetical protein [Lysobacter sp. CA199]|uniref:hypothetical protein n=1 Tax=Lysobacter sp. CA199 TaxID=3455608 RepID=UPI003F8D6C27
MNLDSWLRLLQMAVILGSVIINVALFVYSRRDKRFADFEAKFSKSEGAQRDFERRLTVMETHIESLPSHDDLQEIRDSLAKVGVDVAGIKGQAQATYDSTRRIESHLLERSR